MVKKLYVGKLSAKTTDQMLFDHFSKAGRVVSASLSKTNNPQIHAGHGYVLMGSDREMEKAIHTLNNSILEGSRIIVMEAHQLDQEKRQYYYRRY